ncbi:UNVERIFIED_CONTAM: hypothetical protein Scaly_0957300 [Sesamum calycinum]|uniref:Uncharacterized protein n=1 Tax=Sesamum calycinum TaxID=2727403 RepID=A0AAW2QY56_9LAMI
MIELVNQHQGKDGFVLEYINNWRNLSLSCKDTDVTFDLIGAPLRKPPRRGAWVEAHGLVPTDGAIDVTCDLIGRGGLGAYKPLKLLACNRCGTLVYIIALSEISAIELCIQGMHWELCYILQAIKPKTFGELATRAHRIQMSFNCKEDEYLVDSNDDDGDDDYATP